MTDTEVRPTADEAPTSRRYGGFYKPKAWGIFGLSTGGTLVAGVMAIAAVLLMMSPVGVLGSAALLAVTFLVLRRPRIRIAMARPGSSGGRCGSPIVAASAVVRTSTCRAR